MITTYTLDGLREFERRVCATGGDEYQRPNRFGVCMLRPYRLHGFQSESVQWMLERDRQNRSYVLAMMMGLGKTVTMLTVIASTLREQRGVGSSTLYVCPRHLLATTCHEIRKFFGSSVRVGVYHQDSSRAAYRTIDNAGFSQYDIILTSYDSVVSRYARSDTFRFFSWYRLVLDESQLVRDRNRVRFQTVARLKRRVCACMSGTPIQSSLVDLLTQLTLCGTVVRNRRRGVKYLEAAGTFECIRFVDYGCVEKGDNRLPSLHTTRQRVELSDNERAVYRLSGQRVACSVAYLARHSLPTESALHTWARDRRVAGLQASKFRRLVDLLSSVCQPEKVVVFAYHETVLSLAVEAVQASSSCVASSVVLDSSVRSHHQLLAILHEFETSVSILFTTFAIGGSGLNLQMANHVVVLETVLPQPVLDQAVARVHRMGQKRPVHVHLLVGVDTEEAVHC